MDDSTKRIIFLVKRTFTKRIRLILYLGNTLDRSSNYSNFHHVVKMQQFKLCLNSEKRCWPLTPNLNKFSGSRPSTLSKESSCFMSCVYESTLNGSILFICKQLNVILLRKRVCSTKHLLLNVFGEYPLH